MKHLLITLTLMLCSFKTLASNLPERLQASGISSEGAIESFFNKVVKAVKANDKSLLASLIAYPIKVRGAENSVILTIANEANFIKHYDLIINERVKFTVACTPYNELSATYKGVMFGDGVLWFTETKHKDKEPWVMKITRINNSHRPKELWYNKGVCAL